MQRTGILALLIGADDRSYRMTGSDVYVWARLNSWSTEWVIMIVNELRIIVRVRIQFAVCYGPDPVARTCPTDITCAWYQGCLRPCIQVSWSPVLRAVHTACDFVVDKIGVCVCVCVWKRRISCPAYFERQPRTMWFASPLRNYLAHQFSF